uniref:APELIN n=1 Tax=Homo sapiens TaxID=9606 RepID=Q6UWT3_HUMAN|nr:APELIN [Homo sapiens]
MLLLTLLLLLLLLKGSCLEWGLVGAQKVSSATDAPIRDWAFFPPSFLCLLPHRPAMTCSQAQPRGEGEKVGDG